MRLNDTVTGAQSPARRSQCGESTMRMTFDDGARLEIMNKPGMKDEEKAQARTGYIHSL